MFSESNSSHHEEDIEHSDFKNMLNESAP